MVALVLLCVAPAGAGLISIDQAGNPAGDDAVVICQAAMPRSGMSAFSADAPKSSSFVAWPYAGAARTDSLFLATSTDAWRSLAEMTQLTATTVDSARNTNPATPHRHRPARARAYSLDSVVDSTLTSPRACEDARTGSETLISLLGSPGRG